MAESVDKNAEKDLALKRDLIKVAWPVKWGSVKVQVRDGRPVLVTIEETLKLD